MKHILIATLFVSSLAGCSKSAVDAVSDWKDAACKCKDATCAEKEAKAFWSMAEKFKDDKPSKDDAKKLDKLADDGQECLKNLGVDLYAAAAAK